MGVQTSPRVGALLRGHVLAHYNVPTHLRMSALRSVVKRAPRRRCGLLPNYFYFGHLFSVKFNNTCYFYNTCVNFHQSLYANKCPNVQSNLSKGRIAVLSPVVAANAFGHSPAASEQCAMHSCAGTLPWAGTRPPPRKKL